MASNSKKGVADSVWGFMFILIVIFGLLSYKIAGKYSLDSIFSKISAKISNFIVSTTAISRVPENNSKVKPARIRNSKYDPIPKTKEEQNLLPFMNVKECFERFEVFFFAIKGYFLYVIGYAFMSFMFADQLNKACYS